MQTIREYARRITYSKEVLSFNPVADREVGQYVFKDISNTLTNGTCYGYKNGIVEK